MSDASGGQAPRRFLIATAVVRHRKSPVGDRPGLVAARQQVIQLFTERLGYTHVSELGIDPDRDTLLGFLDDFANAPDRRPDDIVALYLAGHGALRGAHGLEHVFFTTECDLTKPKLALRTSDIASTLTDGTRINQLLLMLDTCHSGQGAGDSISVAIQDLRRSIEDDPAGIAVVASAQPAQQAVVAVFPTLLSAAVDSLAIAGERPEQLSLDALVEAMNAHPERPPTQRFEWDAARVVGRVPAFFPNPRHEKAPHPIDLALQSAAEWDAQALRRKTELVSRMVVRAMASFGEGSGWWFTGRHRTLNAIGTWIRQADASSRLMVLTSGPGSGKTAILGLLAVLALPERRATVPVHALGLDASAIPQVGAIDAAIYAQALTNDDVFRGLTAAARSTAATVGDFADELVARDEPLVVIIDALDEAATPEALVAQLLVPLLEHSAGKLRLLVGTRPHLRQHLPKQTPTIDLDTAEHADADAMAAYALRCLVESHPESLYAEADTSYLVEVAQAVADAAHPSFLVARFAAAALAADSHLPNVHDPEWRASLPRTVDAAMARDLDHRLKHEAQRARDLLRPLAYAEGQGLPWEDLWSAVASRVAGRSYGDDDLLWLKHEAGSYVVEAVEDGRSVYRLYHMALAEHLRRGCDDAAIHRAIKDVLLHRVPSDGEARRDWSRAHPYIVRHLAAHATYAGDLDNLLDDPGFLVHANTDQLLPLLHRVTSDRGRQLRAVYRRSVSVHRRVEPRERRQLLAVDAAREQDHDLARRLAAPLGYTPRCATGARASSALREVLPGHTGAINSVACTTLDGTPIAVTGGADRTVYVWDLERGTQRAALTGHAGNIRAVACTTEKSVSIAVTGGDDHTVRIWDLARMVERETLSGHTGAVSSLACTIVNGTHVVVTGGDDATVRVWDLVHGRQLAVLVGHSTPVREIACAAVGEVPVAVTIAEDGSVRSWRLDTYEELSALLSHMDDHGAATHAAACTEIDGLPVAVTGNDACLRIWDLALRTVARTIHTGDVGVISAISWTTNDDKPAVVTATSDETVRVWDVETGTERAILTGHSGPVLDLACSTVEGTPVVVTVGLDEVVRVWDLPRDSEREIAAQDSGGIGAVACVRIDGRPAVVTTGNYNALLIRELRLGITTQAILTRLSARLRVVGCVEETGTPLAVTLEGGLVRIWDLGRGIATRRTLTRTIGAVTAAACCPMGANAIVVTGDRFGGVAVWDLATGAKQAGCAGPGGPIRALAYTTLGGTPALVSVGEDQIIRSWHPADSRGMLRIGLEDGHRVDAIACAHMGRSTFAVTGGPQDPCGVWDLASRTRHGELSGHRGGVRSIACTTTSSELPRAVTVGGDRTIRVWDLLRCQELDSWVVSADTYCATFGPSGEIVVGTARELLVLEPNESAGRRQR